MNDLKRWCSKSAVLQISIFATGCAGIVAEFVLSTLATYLIGNAIFQWTIVMSLMLFAMGVGSRVSRYFSSNLLDIFILTEFTLSIFCASSVLIAYSMAGFTNYTALIIYSQSFIIGVLIGLEIPLVTRLNNEYEGLRINISSVMEKDYFGSLIGGIIFAFLCLPYLGLTFTPIVLGIINFLVASFLLWRFFPFLIKKKTLLTGFLFTFMLLSILAFFANRVIIYGEQVKYKDKVIYSLQTPYQKIVLTKWKQYYWLYINGQEQFSTYDEEKYHEPLVHPSMKISHNISNVLILGGGDGLALREVLKYKNVKSVTVVDFDPAMTDFAKTDPVLVKINDNAFADNRVTIINSDASKFLHNEIINLYGIIIIDLPDPDSIDLMHLYSYSFYKLLKKHLIKGGVLVTQATSPYFSKKAFLCILKTVKKAGFSVLPYHNQIPTMGEWGWVLGVKSEDMNEQKLKTIACRISFEDINTTFINNDAMISMVHFGKGVLDNIDNINDQITVNLQIDPVLYRYYHSGSWGMY